MAKKDKGAVAEAELTGHDWPSDRIATDPASAREAFVRLVAQDVTDADARAVATFFWDRVTAFFDDVAAIRRAIEPQTGTLDPALVAGATARAMEDLAPSEGTAAYAATPSAEVARDLADLPHRE